MLKNYNDAKLASEKINSELICFCQLWQELLHRQTLDVYQYKILNSYVAVSELKDVIEKTIDGLYITEHNIDDCRAETLEIIKNDDILDKHYLPLKNSLIRHVVKKPRALSEQKMLKYQLDYSLKSLESKYIQFVLQELWNDIQSDNFCSIYKHSNDLISQCIFLGWSAPALRELTRHFIGEDDLDAKWSKFTRNICGSIEINHDVLIGISFQHTKELSSEQSLVTLNSLGLSICASTELVAQYNEFEGIESFFKSQKKYIKISVKAPDVYAAAHRAITELSDKVNIASFYNLIAAWDLKTVTMVCLNMVSKYRKPLTAQELYNTYDYVDSSGKIFASNRKIFLNSSKSNIQDKLKGAFAYTNISRASLFQEEKFMNIWVALESLARTDMYSDIISNVKETLPAALCLRCIYRRIRNFAEDCTRCGVDFNFTTRNIDMNQDTKQLLVQQVIEVFKDSGLIVELREKCKVNRLLCERCEEIYNLINDKQFAKKKIQNHYQKVKWHIQRLYRIRNEIAHSALKKDKSLVIYIEHLYDYLSIFISEIVTCVENKELSLLEEVYSSLKDNYNQFIELAERQDTIGWLDSVFETGIIDLVFTE